MSTEPQNRAWVEVDASALRTNLEKVRAVLGKGVGVVPSVKADAYGLGVEWTIQALEPEDPWGYGVATVPEGVEIRLLGVERPVIVLSPVPPGALAQGIAAGLTLCVSDIAGLHRIGEVAAELDLDATIHVEIDTGMGRSGFDWFLAGDWGPVVERQCRGRIRWEGTFTHFHSADKREADGLESQVHRFEEAVQALTPSVGESHLRHIANSAGVFRWPGLDQDLVRPGIFLYGGRCGADLPAPDEVVAVRGCVVLVREVREGSTLGYGATYRSRRRERWATIGIGYGDGLPRALGNRGWGLVRGHRVPIIGRISMDLTVVDITDLSEFDVGIGERVTFVGTDGVGRISLEEVADLAGTINYEVLTGLSRRLPRVWRNASTSGGTRRVSESE